MKFTPPPWPQEDEWLVPKELAVIIDGHEIVRGAIVAVRIEQGEVRCEDPACPGHMPQDVTILTFEHAAHEPSHEERADGCATP